MSAGFGDDLKACGDLVRRGDPERFRAAMAAPVAARRALLPIYAFNVEVSRAPWVTQEPMIAEMRLQWWRDALAEIRRGSGVRRHEVVTPLAEVLDGAGADLLEALVAARIWDVYRDPFEDAAHFRDYLDKTSANLMLAAARALGPAPEDVLRDAGYAQGLANFLRAIPALESSGRVPLVDGRAEAVRDLAGEGVKRLARARGRRGAVPAACRPALIPVWASGAMLKRALRQPALVAAGGLEISPLRSRFSLIWRVASGRW